MVLQASPVLFGKDGVETGQRGGGSPGSSQTCIVYICGHVPPPPGPAFHPMPFPAGLGQGALPAGGPAPAPRLSKGCIVLGRGYHRFSAYLQGRRVVGPVCDDVALSMGSEAAVCVLRGPLPAWLSKGWFDT